MEFWVHGFQDYFPEPDPVDEIEIDVANRRLGKGLESLGKDGSDFRLHGTVMTFGLELKSGHNVLRETADRNDGHGKPPRIKVVSF